MQDFVTLIGYVFVLFAAAMAAGWLITSLKLGKKAVEDPEVGTCLRLRGPSCMYRSRLLEVRGPFWILSAPLMRDCYVPLRPGEKLNIEVPYKNGVLFARTEVKSRDQESHTLIIERPEGVKPVDRRQAKRLKDLMDDSAVIEGVKSSIVDVSIGGAKVRTQRRFLPGERIRIDLPWVNGPTYGWILESIEISPSAGVEARIRFETELASLPA
jgi:hypothetical protein